MKGHRVANGEVIDESDALDTTTNNLDAFVTEQQLASDEFERAAHDRDEVTAQRHYTTPADPTLVQHVQGNTRTPGAQQTKPGIDGEDVKVVLRHAAIPGRRDQRRKARPRPASEALVE
jgi:hypothetical protein